VLLFLHESVLSLRYLSAAGGVLNPASSLSAKAAAVATAETHDAGQQYAELALCHVSPSLV